MAAHSPARRTSHLALVVRLAPTAAAALGGAIALILAIADAQAQARGLEVSPSDATATAAATKPELTTINLAIPGPGWPSLFAQLRDAQPLHSTFTEIRRFPFKKEGVELRGEMRFSQKLGLSLHYAEPEFRTLVVDEEGILLRDERGRTRTIKAGRRGVPAPAALLPILAFDREKMAADFDARGALADNLWWLEFTPRDDGARAGLGTVLLSGDNGKVQQIEFQTDNGPHVQILIESTETGAEFSPEEIKRWFRG